MIKMDIINGRLLRNFRLIIIRTKIRMSATSSGTGTMTSKIQDDENVEYPSSRPFTILYGPYNMSYTDHRIRADTIFDPVPRFEGGSHVT